VLLAKELVDQREKELMTNGSSQVSEEDDKSNGVYLTYLLSNKNLTRDEIYSNLMEMLIAGTDTVCPLNNISCIKDSYAQHLEVTRGTLGTRALYI